PSITNHLSTNIGSCSLGPTTALRSLNRSLLQHTPNPTFAYTRIHTDTQKHKTEETSSKSSFKEKHPKSTDQKTRLLEPNRTELAGCRSQPRSDALVQLRAHSHLSWSLSSSPPGSGGPVGSDPFGPPPHTLRSLLRFDN
ncbi:hypothetical protein PTTG_28065, partial [Puccinia triticina 1-1 BBBD Race 1]